jgi:hypothetical protein
MYKDFDDRIKVLPELQNKLENSQLISRNNLQRIPKSGVYVFYEQGKPMFVGRSDNMKDRILTQGRQSSTHNSAPFAFSIAKEIAIKKGFYDPSKTRAQIEKMPIFKEVFNQSKKRVAKMSIRYVSIEDPIEQTLFQVYAAMKFYTPYNDFKTH